MSHYSSPFLSASDTAPRTGSSTGAKGKSGGIDIDKLFVAADKRAKHQIFLYERILARVHTHIRDFNKFAPTAKQTAFSVPPILFGEVDYLLDDCIAFIMRRLEDNGFSVWLSGLNRIYISWNDWIPDYVRSEYQKQTGNTIDARGQVFVEAAAPDPHVARPTQPISTITHRPKIPATSGIYSNDLFDKIINKIS